MRVYESEGCGLSRLPGVVALPDNTAEVCAVLKICAALGTPVVARGAGTAFRRALPFPAACSSA